MAKVAQIEGAVVILAIKVGLPRDFISLNSLVLVHHGSRVSDWAHAADACVFAIDGFDLIALDLDDFRVIHFGFARETPRCHRKQRQEQHS